MTRRSFALALLAAVALAACRAPAHRPKKDDPGGAFGLGPVLTISSGGYHSAESSAISIRAAAP